MLFFSAIISQSISRSINKRQDFSFEHIQEIIESIINHFNVGYTPDEILEDLDAQINYPGANKLTDEECE